ncbi:MAG TPA: hypothetical protein VNQ73_14365 [Ilumatobacter sp.]|nr:hypothetical protein [Ilumatobacter sp.]
MNPTDLLLTKIVNDIAAMPRFPLPKQMRAALPKILADPECRKLARRAIRNDRFVDKLQARVVYVAAGYQHDG